MIINSIVYLMTLFLVLYFIFITYKIYSKKRKIKFPPIDAECPNYYIPKNKLGRKICIAKPMYKIYDKNCDMVDVTDMTELEKCNWSRACDIYWEGITNKKINNNNLC